MRLNEHLPKQHVSHRILSFVQKIERNVVGFLIQKCVKFGMFPSYASKALKTSEIMQQFQTHFLPIYKAKSITVPSMPPGGKPNVTLQKDMTWTLEANSYSSTIQ